MLVSLATFCLAAVVIVLIPGPDTVVILRSVLAGGRRRALGAVFGIQSGLAVWITAAVLGLAALLRASRLGYELLHVAGGVYLVWLGVQAFRARALPLPDAEAPVRSSGFWRGFGSGMVSNLLNPKVGVFFVTFLPGFVPVHSAVAPTLLVLGLVFVAINCSYQFALVAFASRVSAWLGDGRVRRRLEVVTGGILVAFGTRLVTES